MGREELVTQSRRTFAGLVREEADGKLCELTHRGVAATQTAVDLQTGETRVLFVLEHDGHRPTLDQADADSGHPRVPC
jgi:hypothetical protein